MITSSINDFNNTFTTENRFQTVTEFLNAYEQLKNHNHFIVNEIPFNKLEKWKFKDNLSHESGKFFKVDGIRVNTNFGNVNMWDQPIINQAEIGILGIVTKIIKGTRYFLMQLKMEPGNVNILQLSPTVQATRSNFLQVHNGKSTLFLDYFFKKGKSKILIDQLQSEQGGRFLRKRNRNMIVEIFDEIQIPYNFFWLTLGEIKNLLLLENFVNMDARSVLSTIPLDYNFGTPKYSDEEVIQWYIDQKVKYELEVEKISLTKLKDWYIDDDHIFNSDRFFEVIAVKIETGNREVTSWTQPMFKDLNNGLIGLIMKKFNKEEHYLFQTKVMPGNIDIIDLSPTISISNYKHYIQEETRPLYMERFIEEKNSKILYQTKQSEEGGRFYHLQTENMIVEIKDEINIPDNYIWLNKHQINKFMPYNMFNIEARSLISTMR